MLSLLKVFEFSSELEGMVPDGQGRVKEISSGAKACELPLLDLKITSGIRHEIRNTQFLVEGEL